MAAVWALGNFQGFHQFMQPYGLDLATQHMGLLWGDFTDMLHGVQPGSGCRLSWVLANHEWVETGVRREDGYIVPDVYNVCV